MSVGTLRGIATGLMILGFLWLCIWAYSGRRKRTFDAASRLPLEEDATASRKKS